ncbi:MAG: hypothetical protein RID09_15615 [Coleofasciculus sp. G1-WW12-02]|uniref:hypothetical protein n=1 Tax=unclassified Coleofasciculus TaxID=2692782 RepID=UPI0033036E54
MIGFRCEFSGYRESETGNRNRLFNQGKQLEALIEGLRAGIPLKPVNEAKADTWIKVLTVLTG